VSCLINLLSTNFRHTQMNPSRDGRTSEENRVDSRLAATSLLPQLFVGLLLLYIGYNQHLIIIGKPKP
jgi:hypothetical protein